MTSNSTLLWAILPDALTAREEIRANLSEVKMRADTSERPETDWIGNKLPKKRVMDDEANTAIVPVQGVLLNRATSFDRWLGDIGYEDVIEDVQSAIAGGSKMIVLDIDSPGGTVAGAGEAVRRIRKICEAAGVSLMAWSNGTMASAAYWLGQSAGATFSTPSADLGSIGAVVSFLTYERALDQMGISAHIIASDSMKTIGNPMKEPSPEHLLALKERIDEAADAFKTDVLTSRSGIALEALDARVVSGKEAIELGMSDGNEESLEAFLQTLSTGVNTPQTKGN